MKLRLFFFALFFILFSVNLSYAQSSKKIYSDAVRAARRGNLDFAFMQYHLLSTNYPESRYSEEALFAIGEYYFLKKNYNSSAKEFIKFAKDFPDSKARLFALIYLFKIAQVQNKDILIGNFKNEIITAQQFIFLFKDSKEYQYNSPLFRKHKVIYYIDKVEFFIEGELFATIPY